MVLTEIVFTSSSIELKIVKDKDTGKILVFMNGDRVFEIDEWLAPLIGDCLSHMGKETDFLGLRSHLE